MSAPLFAQTKRLKEAIALINQFDAKKFTVLLARIINRLPEKAARLFSNEELEALCQLTGFNSTDLSTTLDACAYMLEQGAYRGVDAGTLSQQLIESGLSEVHSAGFAAVWSEKAATFVAQLRDRALGTPHALSGVDWRLHLAMGQNTLNKTQDLLSVFHFQLGANSSFEAEFNEQQLLEFYMQLEKIQQQFDSLT